MKHKILYKLNTLIKEKYPGIKEKNLMYQILFDYFLLSSIFYIRRKYSNHENFRLQVLMHLHVLRYHEHNSTIFTKYLSVCDANFVLALA